MSSTIKKLITQCKNALMIEDPSEDFWIIIDGDFCEITFPTGQAMKYSTYKLF